MPRVVRCRAGGAGARRGRWDRHRLQVGDAESSIAFAGDLAGLGRVCGIENAMRQPWGIWGTLVGDSEKLVPVRCTRRTRCGDVVGDGSAI